MAITASDPKVVASTPFQIIRVQCSTLIAAKTETVTHGGPSGCSPDLVIYDVITSPTSSDPVFMNHIAGSDDSSGGTSAIRFDTNPGGDLTGAVVYLYFVFFKHASAGLTNVS